MTDTLTPGSETAWISHAALCNTVGDHLLIRKRPSVDFDKGQIYSHALPIPLLPVCLLSPGYLLFLPCICIWGVDVAPMKSPVSGALLGSSYWVTSRQTPQKGPKGGLLMQLTFNEWGTQTFSSKTEQIVSFFLAQDCEHVYFCSGFGHLNKGVCGDESLFGAGLEWLLSEVTSSL